MRKLLKFYFGMVEDFAIRNLKKAGIELDGLKYPKHIAFSFKGHTEWSKENEKDLDSAYRHMFAKVHDIVAMQGRYDVPIVTVYLLTSKVNESKDFAMLMDKLGDFFENLSKDAEVFKNKVKVSVLGKWYNLPGKVIDPIKKIIDETREYDSFFLNLCVNYDGQEEIVDACKVLLRRVLAEKASVDVVDKDMIKENLYSSYFLPPDLLIRLGKQRTLNGFMLWDSTQSIIHFSDVYWQDFTEKDFLKSIKYYQEYVN